MGDEGREEWVAEERMSKKRKVGEGSKRRGKGGVRGREVGKEIGKEKERRKEERGGKKEEWEQWTEKRRKEGRCGLNENIPIDS